MLITLCTSKVQVFTSVTTHFTVLTDQPKTTTFTTGTPNNAVLQGDKATLSCYADGFPPPTYTIKRNEVVVLSSAARGVYEINSIQVAEESVTYSCESSNSLGDGPQKNLIVTVLGGYCSCSFNSFACSSNRCLEFYGAALSHDQSCIQQQRSKLSFFSTACYVLATFCCLRVTKMIILSAIPHHAFKRLF